MPLAVWLLLLGVPLAVWLSLPGVPLGGALFPRVVPRVRGMFCVLNEEKVKVLID